jgi:hypothetical protein
MPIVRHTMATESAGKFAGPWIHARTKLSLGIHSTNCDATGYIKLWAPRKVYPDMIDFLYSMCTGVATVAARNFCCYKEIMQQIKHKQQQIQSYIYIYIYNI